jgi:hypothetical protein
VLNSAWFKTPYCRERKINEETASKTSQGIYAIGKAVLIGGLLWASALCAT